MRLISVLTVFCLALMLCAAVMAQDTPPPAPAPPSEDVAAPAPPAAPPAPASAPAVPAPTPAPVRPPAAMPHVGPAKPVIGVYGSTQPVARPLVVTLGPDAVGATKQVKGTISIVAIAPTTLKPASISVSLDGKTPLNPTFNQPGHFQGSLNTASIADGPHSIKAVFKDAGGNPIGTATRSIMVANAAAPVKPAKPVTAAVKPVVSSPKPAPGLTKAFANGKYGFSIHYPAGWTTADKTTAMRPQKAGNGWIAFSPVKKSDLVVNVRRMRLDPKTGADTFAKFNPYVNKWDKKTVLDAPAFATNTDTGNKIIHRLIIIKSGCAWMLNCIDGAGKTSDAGQKLFNSMVDSFAVNAKVPAAVPTVRVKPAVKAIKQTPKAVNVKELPNKP